MLLAWLLPHFQSLPPLPESEWCPSSCCPGADFWVGGLVYILGPCGPLQQTLLRDWQFLTLPQPLQIFTARGYEALFAWSWNPGMCGLSWAGIVHSPPHLFLPVLSAHQCGSARSTGRWLATCSFPPWLPTSAPPPRLEECFFFNSLFVRHPYNSISIQPAFLGWFLFLDWLVIFLVVRGGEVYLYMPLSWL